MKLYTQFTSSLKQFLHQVFQMSSHSQTRGEAGNETSIDKILSALMLTGY